MIITYIRSRGNTKLPKSSEPSDEIAPVNLLLIVIVEFIMSHVNLVRQRLLLNDFAHIL